MKNTSQPEKRFNSNETRNSAPVTPSSKKADYALKSQRGPAKADSKTHALGVTKPEGQDLENPT